MSFPAKLEIITYQESEQSVKEMDGSVRFENSSAFIEFALQKDITTCLGISPGLATITRVGDDPYTMILEEGKSTGVVLNLNENKLKMSVDAKKVLLKKSDGLLEVYLAYTLSFFDQQVETKVRLKCRY